MTTTVDSQKGNGNIKQTLGAQAAAAASPTPIKPEDKPGDKPGDKLADQVASSPTVVVEGAKDDDGDDDDESKEPGKKRIARKVYVCVGEVHEFTNNREAEKYLNDQTAPTSFDVIKGTRLVRRHRVTLE